uniref:Uncharacterized protein TCIL3000_3_1180 n=1 Tax=Trypanosoma congolense (strain IL3000) TaxID=1068625 RepID=G0UJY8_TRYCI|nr:unnamed protein product [Trypanosoma congolense IL3000]
MNGSRVIVAKRLPHANLMEINHQQQPREGDQQSVVGNLPSAADYQHAAQPGGATIGNSTNVSQPLLQPTMDVKQAVAGGAVSAPVGVRDDIHWRRANYIKQLYGSGGVSPFSANLKKDSNEAESEFKLRYLEKQRDEMKSRKIGEALMERLTVRCYVSVSISRPETVQLKFQNPFSRGMQFSVEVDPAAGGKLEVVSPPTFHLGPREQLDLLLVVRLHELGPAEEVQMLGNNSSEGESRRLRLLAYVYTFTREAVRIIEVNATVGPALVDRRYEIFGASGSKVVKKIFSRTFSSTRFPVSMDRENLLMTMRDACVCVGIASDQTKAESHIVLDPITQSFVTAWEEITISTTIPQHCNEQRVEYLTLFEDAKRCKVLEVWN